MPAADGQVQIAELSILGDLPGLSALTGDDAVAVAQRGRNTSAQHLLAIGHVQDGARRRVEVQPGKSKELAAEVHHQEGRANSLARRKDALQRRRALVRFQRRRRLVHHRVLQAQVRLAVQQLGDVDLPRPAKVNGLPDVHDFPRIDHAFFHHRDFALLEGEPLHVAAAELDRAHPTAVVIVEFGPIDGIGPRVVDLDVAHQVVADLDVTAPAAGGEQHPVRVGADGACRPVGQGEIELRPESGPLTHRIAGAAAAAPARAAAAFHAVVIGLHRDHVAARGQVRRNVIGVVALAPWIAARRSTAQIAPVDPEHVAVGRRNVQLRLRGRGIQTEATPGHEIAMTRFGITVSPDPAGRPVRNRCQFGWRS